MKSAARGRVPTSTKIVCFWVGFGLLAMPAAFLGWRYTLGIAAGMTFAGLWAWRYDHVR